jgi:hypothetical protein
MQFLRYFLEPKAQELIAKRLLPTDDAPLDQHGETEPAPAALIPLELAMVHPLSDHPRWRWCGK